MRHLQRYLTPEAVEDIDALLSRGAYADYDRYGDFILLQNRLLTPDELRNLPAFNEGLENRWHRCMQESVTYEEALAAIKTRRYAYSRLCRMGAYTLLSPSRHLMDQSYEQGPQYARLLALSRNASPYIKEIKKGCQSSPASPPPVLSPPWAGSSWHWICAVRICSTTAFSAPRPACRGRITTSHHKLSDPYIPPGSHVVNVDIF